ncbi:MAG: VWA domain-containing protein, partial [Gammaproteobacteria bacterium]|nr:VWA domain-containing protein [Gammaproteobacteria bacterium]
MYYPNTKKKLALAGLLISLLISSCAQDQKQIEQSESVSSSEALTSHVLSRHQLRQYHEQEVKAKMLKAESIGSSKRVENIKRSRVMSMAPMGDFVSQGSFNKLNRDEYGKINQNSVKLVTEDPVSTFSIDVDTGAYAVVRRHLNQGLLPPKNAVRIEELINYFDYQYPKPRDSEAPFSVSTELAPTPWNKNTHLLQVGLQGYLPVNETRSAANLVFLLDVSGSMNATDKLPLLKNAFRLLVNQLSEQDSVSIVVYAGSSGVVLEPTKGNLKGNILAALDKLSAGGSTHGSAGIQLAYSMAEQSFIKGGINRVILATDGDFNVGTVNHESLLDLIESKKAKGISLTTLGFGQGNYNDHLMEQLADHGDGNYAYIDNLNEARKTLVEQISATLETIAKDVKIQLEWNPSIISEYRLIGYENRLLNREDFNNDKVDAGEIGAGHTVTALYEITFAGAVQTRIEALRYQSGNEFTRSASNEIAYLKLRYKKPGETNSRLIQHALGNKDITTEIDKASDSLRFAASVAAFGELLRGGNNLQQFGYQDVLNLAR